MQLRVYSVRAAFAAGTLVLLGLTATAQTATALDARAVGSDKSATPRSSAGRVVADAEAIVGNGSCGDTIVDPGEECDPPDGLCCDASCHFEADGTVCANEFYCDGQEACEAGECADGPDPCVDREHCDDELNRCLLCIDDSECLDDDPCTTDACTVGICVFTRIPDCRACETGDDCEDGNPCTDDVCLLQQGEQLGVCQRTDLIPGAPCPDDDNPCTDDVCDGAGTCDHPIDDTNDCADEVFCDGSEVCQAGECVDGPDPCVDLDHCDEEGELCWECIGGDECLDDDPCTEDDCLDHLCVHESIPGCCLVDDECMDDNACTSDECLDNLCINEPIPDCCLTAEQCIDDSPCTTDDCIDNACVNESIPGCCLVDDDCDDDDDCTDDACIDNACVHTPMPGCDLVVDLDIKPGSCPNPVNPKSRGVVPMAILGSEFFDVADIDIGSLWLGRGDGRAEVQPLMGPPGPGIKIGDVATPYDGGEYCECHEMGGDGLDDLLLKFDTPEMVEALELDTLQSGVIVSLTLGGTLLDGTPFTAEDCIRIPGKKPNLDRPDWRPSK